MTEDWREPAYEAVKAVLRDNRARGGTVMANALAWRAVDAALKAVRPPGSAQDDDRAPGDQSAREATARDVARLRAIVRMRTGAQPAVAPHEPGTDS